LEWNGSASTQTQKLIDNERRLHPSYITPPDLLRGSLVGLACLDADGTPVAIAQHTPRRRYLYLAYIASMAAMIVRVSPEGFRDWADDEDEGLALISVMTLAAIAFSLVSVFSLLNAQPKPNWLVLSVSLISARLAWIFLQSVAALHYAHIYYRNRLLMPGNDSAGLEIPGHKQEPGVWDWPSLHAD
jgi:uncharacterized membrane protein